MHKVFCIALQDITGVRTFITFGGNTPVNDIMDVIEEETKANPGTKILGMSFLSNPNKKNLRKQISDWKNHFDK